MHLYFIVFKNKKEDDYKLFTNTIFDKEKDADEFGRKSMKRGFEHKVLEYNNDGIIPNHSYLGISYPNPFNMRINIPIYLEKKSIVKIIIFNLLGESIYSAEYNLQQGKTTINWSGKTNMGQTISTGIYFKACSISCSDSGLGIRTDLLI